MYKSKRDWKDNRLRKKLNLDKNRWEKIIFNYIPRQQII
jgi:hypothetical protein